MLRILLMKKRYWALLALLAVITLDAWLRMPDARSRQLTAALEAQASPEMKAYPYHFHVMKFQGDTAWLITATMMGHMFARVGEATLAVKWWLYFMMSIGLAGAFVVPALWISYTHQRIRTRLALIDGGFWIFAYLAMGLAFFLLG